jgi:hypothetical protein
LNLTPKRGRPAAHALLPEHAAVVRRAVKAAARYFGIQSTKLGDSPAGVREAMRTESPLTVRTAVKLFRAVQQPSAELTAKKRPQGPSLEEMQNALLRFRDDPLANPLPNNAAIDYLVAMSEAAAIINLYHCPLPGSSMFVMPGVSGPLAEAMADAFVEELPRKVLIAETRRKLVHFLTHTFQVAERPLCGKDGKPLLPHLMRLAVANRREIELIIFQQLPDQVAEERRNIAATLEALDAAETHRSEALKNPAKKPPRKERKPKMRRIRDALQ